MRTYCAEAASYGCVTEPKTARLTNVLVIVNPLANRRTAQKSVSTRTLSNISTEPPSQSNSPISTLQFDDYCAPILHLSGVAIEILKTDSEGHARRHIEALETLPDAIIVAGGDGTVSEAITGLLRRSNGHGNTPIGVLPCGRTNTLARQLFGYSDESAVHEVRGLASAAIAVVRGRHTATDVIKVEPLHDDAEPSEAAAAASLRPIFAIGSIQWGAYRDALSLRDKYWYCGPGRDYCAFLFNAFSKRLTWECAAQLEYSPPCAGCSNCYVKQSAATATAVPSNTGGANRRWWSGYSAPKGSGVAAMNGAALPDYSRILNPDCGSAEQRAVQPNELLLRHNVQRSNEEVPRLNVQLVGNEPLSAVDFVKEGWSRVRGTAEKSSATAELDVRTVEIRPAAQVLHGEGRETFFSIDNEAYEVKPVRVSVIPRAVRMYT